MPARYCWSLEMS